MTTVLRATAIVAALSLGFGTAVSAQAVAGSFSPNPVAPGTPVTFTGTDATGLGLNLPSSCTWFTIHQGTPAGPVVPLGIGCPAVIVPIAPNGSFSFTWDQLDASGALVAPGLYWFETFVFDPGFTTTFTDFFCISIQPATAPSLVQTSLGPFIAKVGQSTGLTISSAGDPGRSYVTALSLTSNNPINLFGLQFCLSPDVLLNISLVNPGSVMTNSIGFLDAAGNSSGLTVNIPNDPSLAFQGFHTQALISGALGFKLTNDLSFTIQP